MDEDDEALPQAALPPSLTVTALADAHTVLRSTADVSHHHFENLDLERVQAVQSLFSGVVFRRCTIRQCDFERSDFEGARFEQCNIYATNWNHTDIRSTMFVECDISDSTFNYAHVTDNIFLRCIISSTSFSASTLMGNVFNNTTLKDVSNTKATILHTDFNNSVFDGVALADCTALFSIFEACVFKRFIINVDALGLTFGLNLDDLANIKLIFLGKEQMWPDAIDAGAAVIQSFEARRWPLHLAFARLCYSDLPRADAWRSIFDVMSNQIALRHGITIDEAQFVSRVAKRLAEGKRLPFAAVIYGYDRLNRLSFDGTDPSAERRAADLLLSDLSLLLARMHDSLVAGSVQLRGIPSAEAVVAEFTFGEQPSVEPGPYLASIAVINGPASARLLPGRVGSWIQPLQLTGEAVVTVFATLYLLEGCIIQLTRIRARAAVLFSRKVPALYLESANSPKQEMPPILSKFLRSLYASYIDGDLPAPPRNADLTADKLTHVHLIEHSRAPKVSRSRKKQSR